jgi:hypothetical protein
MCHKETLYTQFASQQLLCSMEGQLWEARQKLLYNYSAHPQMTPLKTGLEMLSLGHIWKQINCGWQHIFRFIFVNTLTVFLGHRHRQKRKTTLGDTEIKGICNNSSVLS